MLPPRRVGLRHAALGWGSKGLHLTSHHARSPSNGGTASGPSLAFCDDEPDDGTVVVAKGGSQVLRKV